MSVSVANIARAINLAIDTGFLHNPSHQKNGRNIAGC